jgi:hypothetical protein
MLRCKKGDIRKLSYETQDRTVTFSTKKNPASGESSWWVKITTRPKDALQEETSSDSPPALLVEGFKANDRLQGGLDALCPWKALRSLGKPGEEKLTDFGLAQPGEHLRIDLTSGTRTYRIGATTFGPRDRYVADDESGEVFLVSGQSLRDLLNPKNRYMERSLHAFKDKEVERVKVRGGRQERELVHLLSEEGKELGWADTRSPEEPNDLYRNWIRKLFTLRPTDYVLPPDGEGEEGCVAPPDCTEEMSLVFYGERKEIGFLKVYRGKDESGGAAYYACSEHTEIVVKVPKTQVETLLKDMEDVLSD